MTWVSPGYKLVVITLASYTVHAPSLIKLSYTFAPVPVKCCEPFFKSFTVHHLHAKTLSFAATDGKSTLSSVKKLHTWVLLSQSHLEHTKHRLCG
ncbi:hypothetical protein BKA67DRAFT_543594 [Truncatella angustata]|uniref:Uncharacterized protein n=1 Tax=Truncatella angustata TaxID=152316 RepID=A0A9P8UVH9_9PEZI|nr:uncharacterized protein BKA67DRAFT_543594 [Truncatella angustata]KAH6659112.1 hypothetical protein BKA67DRAFT_543594 [Truncatella angustata]